MTLLWYIKNKVNLVFCHRGKCMRMTENVLLWRHNWIPMWVISCSTEGRVHYSAVVFMSSLHLSCCLEPALRFIPLNAIRLPSYSIVGKDLSFYFIFNLLQRYLRLDTHSYLIIVPTQASHVRHKYDAKQTKRQKEIGSDNLSRFCTLSLSSLVNRDEDGVFSWCWRRWNCSWSCIHYTLLHLRVSIALESRYEQKEIDCRERNEKYWFSNWMNNLESLFSWLYSNGRY